jgi:hypothetical protein
MLEPFTLESHCGIAQQINLTCSCTTLAQDELVKQLEFDPRLKGLTAQLLDTHPHLFSKTSVFIEQSQKQAIERAIAALEAAIALPGYQDQVLKQTPPITYINHGPSGVFMGYDFHLTDTGPKLIEINTNAGGGFLNAALAQAHRACCETMADWVDMNPAPTTDVLGQFMAMFQQEWQQQRGDAVWATAVIVDDNPAGQYLAPEFELARLLLERHGIEVAIVDPSLLHYDGAVLRCAQLMSRRPVDLVYNRLTDFDLSQPAHTALRQAYQQGSVVVTPHPHAWALYAQKSNLVLLSDPLQLATLDLSDEQRTTLQECLPATQLVTPDQADALWAHRRQWFFKPVAGYGSKAVYRGDKLTRRVWADIVQGGYIAQALVAPSERLVKVDGELRHLKVDVRAYTYQGQVQLLAARTYTGQTTNMRTEGGGFSPVVVVADTPGLNLAKQSRAQG